MPKINSTTGSTNGSEVVDKPVDRLNGNAPVFKVQSGSTYVWPSGKAPSTAYGVVIFIGPDDPATTPGGADIENYIWMDTPT